MQVTYILLYKDNSGKVLGRERAHIVRAAFQLSVFYTYVHAGKNLNSSEQFVFNK